MFKVFVRGIYHRFWTMIIVTKSVDGLLPIGHNQ